MTASNHPPTTPHKPQSATGWRRIWRWLVEPAASIQDIGDRRQARLFSSILVVLIPIVLNGLIQTTRLNITGVSSLLMGMFPILVVSYVLSRTKYYRLGIIFTLVAVSAAVFVSFQRGGDYSNPIFLFESLIWMAQTIILGGILLSLRGTVILIVANLLGLVLLPLFFPDVPIQNLMTLTSFMVSISILTVLGHHYRDSLEKERQFELTERNQELEAARAELEQNVTDLTRTTRVLETSETLGRHLAAILDQQQLISTVVEQMRSVFNYYGVHIYLFDETGEYLVGNTGDIDQTQEFKNPRGQGLVGRAAETEQVMLVPDVTQEAAWQPHPLLPETKAEAAAPIVFGGQVLGVLDVQQNISGGLQPEDAELIQAIANQVAVALRNIYLLAEAEAALSKAQAAQERYIEQAWKGSKITQSELKHRYTQVNAPELSETILSQTKAQALIQERPSHVVNDGSKAVSESIVAPVVVGGRTIGALQLHNAGSESNQLWREEDLALVETVLGQVGQVAENLRLFDETRERAGREATIREITDKMRAADSLDQLVRTAAEALGERLGVDLALVELGLENTEHQTSSSNGHANTEEK